MTALNNTFDYLKNQPWTEALWALAAFVVWPVQYGALLFAAVFVGGAKALAALSNTALWFIPVVGWVVILVRRLSQGPKYQRKARRNTPWTLGVPTSPAFIDKVTGRGAVLAVAVLLTLSVVRAVVGVFV